MQIGEIILEIEPSDEEVLTAIYGDIVEGKTVNDLIDAFDVADTFTKRFMEASLKFYVIKSEEKIGPLFIADKAVFTPFFIFINDKDGFHCMDCARLITEWIYNNQMYWAEKYHGDWWDAHGKDYWTRSKRLH